jgi:hypothetical protein
MMIDGRRLRLFIPSHLALQPTFAQFLASSIAPILQNCRFTLEHLDVLVKKYMIIENDGSGGSEKKRWREEIRKNWKKVRWTREGGDLTRLQHNLGVHINSLNLTIAVLNTPLMPSMVAKAFLIAKSTIKWASE